MKQFKISALCLILLLLGACTFVQPVSSLSVPSEEAAPAPIASQEVLQASDPWTKPTETAASEAEQAYTFAEPDVPEETSPGPITSSVFFEPPLYDGTASVQINGNIPEFTDEDLTTDAFEYYSPLDELGRCGPAFANICEELMPTESRGEIGDIKPSGWHTVRYDDLIEDRYLYNRCHLIAFSLAGENDNPRNLITGTRYFNTAGMLPYEIQVAQYVESHHAHVLYRVTPVFENDNLLATGVKIEAYSVEDNGAGVCFNVFVFNVQPGIVLDYQTGDSSRLEETASEPNPSSGDISDESVEENGQDVSIDPAVTYVVNLNTKRFHLPGCASVTEMKAKNRLDVFVSRDELIEEGYVPCGLCKP